MKPLSEMGRYATVVIDPPWDIELGISAPLALTGKNGH